MCRIFVLARINFVIKMYTSNSTVSSGTNSVAMTILEVFVRPCLKEMSDKKGMNISRILSKCLYVFKLFID